MRAHAAQRSPHAPPDTRQRILAVTLDLIARRGFAATSTREIAQELGVTKAALYYHFRTKEELLSAVLAPIIDDLAELVLAGEQGGLDEHALVACYVELVAAHEEPIRVLAQEPAVARHPAVAATKPLYERLTALLSGTAEPDAAARARVRALLGGIHAVFVFAEPRDDRAVLREQAVALAAHMLSVHDGAAAR